MFDRPPASCPAARLYLPGSPTKLGQKKCVCRGCCHPVIGPQPCIVHASVSRMHDPRAPSARAAAARPASRSHPPSCCPRTRRLLSCGATLFIPRWARPLARRTACALLPPFSTLLCRAAAGPKTPASMLPWSAPAANNRPRHTLRSGSPQNLSPPLVAICLQCRPCPDAQYRPLSVRHLSRTAAASRTEGGPRSPSRHILWWFFNPGHAGPTTPGRDLQFELSHVVIHA